MKLPAAALISAGFTNAGLVVGAIGAGCGGVGSFITKNARDFKIGGSDGLYLRRESARGGERSFAV
jgi:hypothetical protein